MKSSVYTFFNPEHVDATLWLVSGNLTMTHPVVQQETLVTNNVNCELAGYLNSLKKFSAAV